MAQHGRRRLGGAIFALTVLFALIAPKFALAQTSPLAGCAPGEAGDPPRAVFTCANGLVLEAETAARLRVVQDGGSEATAVRAGAVLVTVPDGEPFQIRTPHAIASVRGTVFAVAVGEDATAVFVAEGEVGVVSVMGGAPVTLEAGEGVDVEAGATSLDVRQWSAERAAALLARFGR